MSIELLDSTRRIEKLLRDYPAPRIEFNDICEVMSDILDADILLVAKSGKVLGTGLIPGVPQVPDLAQYVTGSRVNAKIAQRFNNVLSTSENSDLELLGIENPNHCHCLLTPVILSCSHLATLLVVFDRDKLGVDDVILCEFGATVIGLEINRSLKEEKASELRDEQNVKVIMTTLSHSEVKALCEILRRVRDGENLIVGTAVADKLGVARASVVNALKKCTSAGILDTRSGGRNGTLIRVLNPKIYSLLGDQDE